MSNFVKYPKIPQFRNVLETVKYMTYDVGLIENEQPIHHFNDLPTLVFSGTVKLHGKNAAVCGEGDELWAQSRTGKLGAGLNEFYIFFNENQEDFKKLIKEIRLDNNIPSSYCIALFGEWVGPGVQKNVGISKIEDKAFFMFGIQVVPDDRTKTPFWLDVADYSSTNAQINNIYDYQTFLRHVDFSDHKKAFNELMDITSNVENECPVSKSFGINNSIGEGIVWTGHYLGELLRFKVKGDKHAGKAKVKKLSIEDEGRLNEINVVVNQITPVWRLDQILTNTFNLNDGGSLDKKRMGEYIKNIGKDIEDEEMDIIKKAGFTFSDVSKQVGNVTREYFFERERINNV